MALNTKIIGYQQIAPLTVTLALLATTLALPDSYLASGADFLKRTGSVAMTGNLDFGNQKGINVANGTNATDLVNFGQLAAVANGFGTKGAADTVSLTNVAAGSRTGYGSYSGYTLTDNDVIGLFGQTTQSENGPWQVPTGGGAWVRPAWYTGTLVSEGAQVIVERGSYAGYSFILTNQGQVTVGTTATTWLTVPTATTYTAGNGVSIAGNTVAAKLGLGLYFDGSSQIAVQLNGTSLATSGAGLKIADGTAGQLMLAGTGGVAAFTTLGGDVTSVSASGVVALNSLFRKTANFKMDRIATSSASATYTLANTPGSAPMLVSYNGQNLDPTLDFTVSGTTLTLAFTPADSTVVLAYYQTA